MIDGEQTMSDHFKEKAQREAREAADTRLINEALAKFDGPPVYYDPMTRQTVVPWSWVRETLEEIAR